MTNDSSKAHSGTSAETCAEQKDSDGRISATEVKVTETRPSSLSGKRPKVVPTDEAVYCVERVTSLEDLRKILELRYEYYCERLGAFPLNPDGIETDEYDAKSVHFQAVLDGSCIGTLRLVPQHEGRFPMEEHGFQLPTDLPRARALEVSRIIARPLDGHSPALDLAKCAYDWSVANGSSHWIYSANRMTLIFMRKNHLVGDSIGPPEHHHNDTYFPFVMPLTDSFRFPW